MIARGSLDRQTIIRNPRGCVQGERGVMSEEGEKEEEMEPFTMITKEDVEGASAGIMGTFSSSKAWIQVRERERDEMR